MRLEKARNTASEAVLLRAHFLQLQTCSSAESSLAFGAKLTTHAWDGAMKSFKSPNLTAPENAILLEQGATARQSYP